MSTKPRASSTTTTSTVHLRCRTSWECSARPLDMRSGSAEPCCRYIDNYSRGVFQPALVQRESGPWSWIVTWGVLARPGFAVEHVTAYDADEAIVVAAERRPDLGRPTAAFLR